MKDSHKPNKKSSFTIIFNKIERIYFIVIQTGCFRLMKIGYIYFLEPILMSLVTIYAQLRLQWKKKIQRNLQKNRSLNYWSDKKREIIQNTCNTINIDQLGLNDKGINSVKEEIKGKKELVIAHIDQDGFYLSHYGPIKGIPCISEDDFLPRIKYSLDLVVTDGLVGVKKKYGNNPISFLTELEILNTLSRQGCNVPSILDVDFENYSLTLSFIPGKVLREELASKGSILRDRDVNNNPNFKQLSNKERKLKRIDEGKKHLYSLIDDSFIQKLYRQISKIHSANVFINDIKYGNVIIHRETGEPYLIDFELSEDLSGMGDKTKRILFDSDIEQFNLHFGTNKLTYRILNEIIKNSEYPHPNQWYAPSYFGCGLRIGGLYNPEVGWGRWNYLLKENLPNPTGYRVLDLGANNGFNSLQLLRNGAKEAIAFEIEAEAIEQGMFLKSAYEWSDRKHYNFRYINSNMADLVTMDLGSFDMVMALCSIYYLEDDEITILVRHISSITNCFIVQCNIAEGIGREDPHTYEKASVEYIKNKLEKNGFPQVEVISTKGYSRPLLIARHQ